MQWGIDVPQPDSIPLETLSAGFGLVLQLSVAVVGWFLGAVTSWCQNYSSGAPGRLSGARSAPGLFLRCVPIGIGNAKEMQRKCKGNAKEI